MGMKPEKPYTLVVIDMQYKFRNANNKQLIKNIEEQIKKAISNNLHIILVQFDGFGRTNLKLINLVRGYGKAYLVNKCMDDGSSELNLNCKINKIPIKRVVACGVNTRFCVLSTVYGLANRYNAKVEVPVNCCNDDRGFYSSKKELPKELNPFHKFELIDGVKLV